MALIKCPECGKEISDTCSRCIHCGYALRKHDVGYESDRENYKHTPSVETKTSSNGCLWVVVITVAIFFLLAIAGSGCSSPTDGHKCCRCSNGADLYADGKWWCYTCRTSYLNQKTIVENALM